MQAAQPPWDRPGYLALKRAFDIMGALLGLLFFFLVLPLVALAIRLDSRGPVFFVQTRVGRFGKRFKFVKLRTMEVNAHLRQWELDEFNESAGATFKMRSDPRVTRIGRWLRRTSLDEMPQFWNVLRGDMSLVGPRPPLLREVAGYDRRQMARLAVAQGMTGLWQVRGRSLLPFGRMVDLDLHYALHADLRLDIEILLRTIPAVLFGRGAV